MQRPVLLLALISAVACTGTYYVCDSSLDVYPIGAELTLGRQECYRLFPARLGHLSAEDSSFFVTLFPPTVSNCSTSPLKVTYVDSHCSDNVLNDDIEVLRLTTTPIFSFSELFLRALLIMIGLSSILLLSMCGCHFICCRYSRNRVDRLNGLQDPSQNYYALAANVPYYAAPQPRGGGSLESTPRAPVEAPEVTRFFHPPPTDAFVPADASLEQAAPGFISAKLL